MGPPGRRADGGQEAPDLRQRQAVQLKRDPQAHHRHAGAGNGDRPRHRLGRRLQVSLRFRRPHRRCEDLPPRAECRGDRAARLRRPGNDQGQGPCPPFHLRQRRGQGPVRQQKRRQGGGRTDGKGQVRHGHALHRPIEQGPRQDAAHPTELRVARNRPPLCPRHGAGRKHALCRRPARLRGRGQALQAARGRPGPRDARQRSRRLRREEGSAPPGRIDHRRRGPFRAQAELAAGVGRHGRRQRAPLPHHDGWEGALPGRQAMGEGWARADLEGSGVLVLVVIPYRACQSTL